MITIRFACGHGFTLASDPQSAPTCPTCGETRISRTTAPAPRFTGLCSGPTAETRALAAIPIAIPRSTDSHG